MATQSELDRLGDAQFDFEMKFYVGGPYGLTDITGITAGATYNPNASTTLDGDHDASDVSIKVLDASAFTTGTICIAPEASGEYYEVIGYGNIVLNGSDYFTNLRRPDTADPEMLFHSDGADVTEWLEITNFVTGLPSLVISENNGVVDWKASIRGQDFNSTLLANDRAILAMWRFRSGSGILGDWTNWTVAFVGYLHSVKPSDSKEREKEWTADVGSIWMYISKTDVPSTVYGRTNLAEGASITASSTLEDPFAEYGKGEYLGWAASFAPALAIDGNMDTLWISDDIPDATPDTVYQSGVHINEIYLRPETWWDPSLMWFEIVNYRNWGDFRLSWDQVFADCTTWKDANFGDPPPRIPANNYLLLPSLTFSNNTVNFVIMTNNKVKFLERWKDIDQSVVYDWRPFQVGTFTLNPDKDFIGMQEFGVDRNGITWWHNSDLYPSYAPFYYTGDSGDGTGWTGAILDTKLTVLPKGHSYRRNPTNNAPSPEYDDYYVVEVNPSPGGYYTGASEWVKIDIGQIDIDLDADIDASSTTELVVTSTLGLTTTGYVLLDEEIIGYATRDSTNNKLLSLTRGCFETTPAAHYKASASPIGQYEGGATTYNHLVNLIQWKRKPVLATVGPAPYVVPYIFNIFTSTLTSVITPDDANWNNAEGSGGWRDYWQCVAWVGSNKATSYDCAFSPKRVRQVLINIREMSDTGRAKLNEVTVFTPTGNLILTPDDDREDVWEGTWTGEVIFHMLETVFGISISEFTLTNGGMPVVYLPVTKGAAGKTIQELLDRTGAALIFNLDNTVEHTWSVFDSCYGWPDIDVEWDRDNAQKVVVDIGFAHNVKQVTVQATDPFTDTIYTAIYPVTPNDLGEEITIDRLVIGDQLAALLTAERIYKQKNAPVTLTVTPVGPGEFIRPGDRHTVTWDLDEEGNLYNQRNFVVSSVSYTIRFSAVKEGSYTPPGWSCSVQLKELK